jgi:putative drug exporter of the RND superfamily
VTAFFGGLGRFTVKYRWLVLGLWLVVIIVSSRALPSLSSEINNNNSQFLPASAPSNQAATLAIPVLGNQNRTSQVVIVAARLLGPLTAGDQAAVTRVIDAARQVPKVVTVRDVGTSSEGNATQIYVTAEVSQANISDQKTLINNLEATVRSADVPAGLQVHLAGPVAANVANQEKSANTGRSVQSLSLLLIIVLLLLVFRSLLAPLITLLPAAVALLVANRFIGGLGAHGLQISEITQLLLIVLLLGAGTDYGLFLVFRVREELHAGRDPHDAVARSVTRVGESISASAGTVILALLSLLFASFGIYHDLGIPLAVGIGVMLVAGLTLLPALLSVFGTAAFWPSRVGRSSQAAEGWWGRVAGRVLRRPALALGVGVLCFAGLASFATGYQAAGFGGALNAPKGTDAAAGNAILVRYFPQSSTNPTNLVMRFSTPIWDHPESVAAAQSALETSREFTTLAGPLNPTGTTLTPAEYTALHQAFGPAQLLPRTPPSDLHGYSEALYNAYRSTSAFVSSDGRTIQFQAALTAGDPSSTAALRAVPRLRAATTHAAAVAGAEASGVAGEAPALYDVSSTSDHDLATIIPIAILAIGLLLALVLRSAIAPLYLIVSVALSYFAALGVAVLVFMDIAGDSGLTFILPFLMFIFLLALGEDYNILVMTRIREEAHVRDLRPAVIRAVGRTGPTVTSAGLVLAGTFAVFAFAGASGPGGSQIRAVGIGLSVGILMDTFFVRTVLVPATVMLLGRWNWWPGHLSREESTTAEGGAAVSAGVR